MDEIDKRANCEDAERPMWLPEHCVCPVDVPADTRDHEDDLDSTNIGTGAMDVGSISNLLGIMGISKDGLQILANTLEGDKDLNSPRELSAEAEKELALVEKTIREAHVDRVNPELKCILVILPSRHSPTGILMQREDIILEWIFLPCKSNKKLKTYIEKISDLIHK
ncbi:hypothetical protein STEG23_004222, partial [Scotinomys teguina]